MNEAKRQRNERKFPSWEALPEGGRKYLRVYRGVESGEVHLLKEVDANENTLRVYQEVYNSAGELIGLHQKFPEDAGHQVIRRK